MIPSQLIRSLRPACRLAGLPEPDPPDSATHEDAIELLSELAAAVDDDRPRPPRAEPSGPIGRPPAEDAEEILALARAGVPDAEIARRLGRSYDAVRGIRRRRGVEPPEAPAPAEPSWAAQVRELHDRGLTHAEIAAETGWAPATVRQYAWRLGLRANQPRGGG